MIRQDKISPTKSTRFPGIIIDDKLKWAEHIDFVNKQNLNRQVHFLK